MQLLIAKTSGKVVRKGDIVEVRATGTPFGGAEPGAFVLVEVPDMPMRDVDAFGQAWHTDIAWSVVARDVSQDGYRIRLYSEAVSAGGDKGIITRTAVERFIESWGGRIVSTTSNEVRFDLRILDALTSRAFWGIDRLEEIGFTEEAYHPDTGLHRLRIDYTRRGVNPTFVERFLMHRGGQVTSHVNGVVVCDFARDTIRDQFLQDIRSRGRTAVARCRYYVPEAVVDQAIAQGGRISTDAETVMQHVRDKRAD